MNVHAHHRVLVTGASRGVGRAAALALAAQGASVCAVARGKDDLATLDDALTEVAPSGALPRHTTVAADLSDPAGTEMLLDALALWGQPHVVVANVWARTTWAPVGTTAPGDLGSAVAANVDHVLRLAPAALALQRRDGFGRWIAISSVAAHLGGPGQASYSAHKAAMESLMRTIAVEEGRSGITANTVLLGFVDTPGARAARSGASFALLAEMNVLGRAGSVEEVAHAVAFFAHPLAAYVTGTTMAVCGGADLGWWMTRRQTCSAP